MPNIEPGIRKKGHRWEATRRVNGELIRQSFPDSTPLTIVREWRRLVQMDPPKWARRSLPEPRLPRDFPVSLDGWCYLYVIQSGAHVKIGRAVNVAERLMNLQVGTPEELRLLAAAPAHWTLEAMAHARFENDQLPHSREWFRLSEDICRFVVHLQDGLNPLTFFWPQTVSGQSRACLPARVPRDYNDSSSVDQRAPRDAPPSPDRQSPDTAQSPPCDEHHTDAGTAAVAAASAPDAT